MNKLKQQEKIKILELLINLQQMCGPIEISIGWNQHNERQSGILIKKAAPYVTEELIKRGYHLDIKPFGVQVIK